MPFLTQKEIIDRAFNFVKEWESTTREKSESQSFWNDFFNIFGISRRRVASFEEPVRKLGDKAGSIDLFWKGTLLIEHKSQGKDLSKAYSQALDYFPGIQEQDLPRFVLVSDFTNFRLYDLETNEESDFKLKELPAKLHLFGFISGYKAHAYHDEDPVNIKVAEKMGELHDALLESGYEGHNLEIFLVRLVYCLFADDTGIFPKDHFHYFIENRMNPNGSDTGANLSQIFQILNTPEIQRQKSIDDELLMFPYINGLLFDEVLAIPMLNKKMRNLLLECCSFDWSKVSPAIFGSMFQAVMDKEQRRALGAHYTSEKNILKVINGLFLNDLNNEFELSKNDLLKLKQLHERISQMKFFDPACGCGNFLVIAYREIRRLEIKILKSISRIADPNAHQLVLDVSTLSKIDVDSLYGIEIEEFPARIAEVALWLTDHRMNMELSQEFGLTFVRLPLKKSANIINGNALRINWESVIPISTDSDKTLLYIFGNPPFIGKKMRTAEQNEDMDLIFGDTERSGILDYVACWYAKAADYIRNTKNQVAFVSTNSITQGEQVEALWQYLFRKGVVINFAHRTFRWSNEARGKAAVFCVVIGFSAFNRANKKIYDYSTPDADSLELNVKRINPYLVDAENLIITNRTTPICDVPDMSFGSMPNDDGNLLFDEVEKEKFLTLEPNAKKFIRPLISAREFLHGEKRYCLWLKDADPLEIKGLPEIRKRIEAVRKYRSESKREATRKLAETPGLFGEIRQPETDYVLIPRHSSENRRYIPMEFFDKDNVAGDSCVLLTNAHFYHFGILQSIMHIIWTKQVCGRIKGDFRYSNNIVYNNFIWPENPTEKQKARVEEAAKAVLAIRARFSESTLADLYDPDLMPKALRDVHQDLDRAVDLCYRSTPFKTELERLTYLFGLYQRYTTPFAAATPARKSNRKVV